MDRDGSTASVSQDEFLEVMAAEVDDDFQENPSHERLAEDLCAALPAHRDIASRPPPPSVARLSFSLLDKNHNGSITFSEFREVLHDLPIDLSEDSIDEVLREMFAGGGDTTIDKVRPLQPLSAAVEFSSP